MLNAVELCDYDKNHNSTICNINVGKYAGKLLKYNDYWKVNEEGEKTVISCNDGCEVCEGNGLAINPDTSKGVDAYGFSVLPAGYGDAHGSLHYMGEQTEFWTMTETERTDVYTKRFYYNKSNIVQIAESPYALCSVRLVKDYNGTNFRSVETINGQNYQTVLMPSEKSENGYSIWIASNVAFDNERYNPRFHEESEIVIEDVGYYINEWTGLRWLKKRLNDGESLVIKVGPDGDDNREYRLIGDELINIKHELRGELLDIVDELDCPIVEKKGGYISSISQNNGKVTATAKDFISQDIPVAGGPLANLVASTTRVISAGTNIQDLLFTLFCKELYPYDAHFLEGGITSTIDAPSFQVYKSSTTTVLNDNVEIEAGSLIDIKSIVCPKTNYRVIDSIFDGFDYGYSVDRDGKKDRDGNPPKFRYSSPEQKTNYYLERTFSGFDNKISTQIANNDRDYTKVSVDELQNVTIADGNNTISSYASGATYSTYFDSDILFYYACSNLGSTHDNYLVSGYTHTKTTSKPTSAYNITIKGARCSFIGTFDNNNFVATSDNIRNNLSKIAFNKSGTTKVVASPGQKCVVIAYPKDWGEIKQIKDVNAMNSPILLNFEKLIVNVEGANGYKSKPYYVYVYNADITLGAIDYDIIF